MHTSEITKQLKQKKRKTSLSLSLPSSDLIVHLSSITVYILTRCERGKRENSLFDVIPTEFLRIAFG